VNGLWLLRHAHARSGDAASDDHDRPLSDAGLRAADRIGAHLAAQRETPSLILCSSALRAVETLDRIRPLLPESPRVRTDRALYLATGEEVLAYLSEIDDRERRVLVLGHNPGLQALACALAGSGDPSSIRRLERNFPSGACAALNFETSWRDLAPQAARLTDFSLPEDLS
jgi:phosphohistidine phosphatase